MSYKATDEKRIRENASYTDSHDDSCSACERASSGETYSFENDIGMESTTPEHRNNVLSENYDHHYQEGNPEHRLLKHVSMEEKQQEHGNQNECVHVYEESHLNLASGDVVRKSNSFWEIEKGETKMEEKHQEYGNQNKNIHVYEQSHLNLASCDVIRKSNSFWEVEKGEPNLPSAQSPRQNHGSAFRTESSSNLDSKFPSEAHHLNTFEVVATDNCAYTDRSVSKVAEDAVLVGEMIVQDQNAAHSIENSESLCGTTLSLTLSSSQTQTQPGAIAVAGPRESSSVADSFEDQNSQLHPIEATLVRDHESNATLPNRLMRHIGIVYATDVQNIKLSHKRLMVWTILVILTLATTVSLAVGLNKNRDGNLPTESPSSVPTSSPIPTLDAAKERGELRCGVTNRPGFSQFSEETGRREGFDADLCRAVAASVFGDASKVKFVVVESGSERFLSLAARSIDLLTRTTTFTMERDVYENNAEEGFTFSTPYLYEGLSFGGNPSYLNCANIPPTTLTGECSALSICVLRGTTYMDVIGEYFPGSKYIAVGTRKDLYGNFSAGNCNVISGGAFDVATVTVLNSTNYKGPYEENQKLFSKEPFAMVTKDGDSQWSELVDWTLQALFNAEERNITQSTVELASEAISEEINDMTFVKVISAVGNYGEMYSRHLQTIVPRTGLNFINRIGNTGLLYAFPFGRTENVGPGPVQGGALEKILQRKFLKCGIRPHRSGFAELDNQGHQWRGIDVDYCRAISSSIFEGVHETVMYVEIRDGLEKLSLGEVDIIAGAASSFTWNQKELRKGIAFSQPYFYHFMENTTSVATLALATRQDDPQWASFVYWIVSATYHAEERGLSQSSANQMPIVNIFGSSFKRMFRNAILTVGSYADMYNRNLISHIDRNGRNQINDDTGPQHYSYLF